MRQLTFIKPGLLEWWDVPTPQLEGQGDALVRPVAVATCNLDGVIMRGQVPFTGPFAFGHEFVAQVIEVGSDVHSITPGQLVVVPFQIACGECVPTVVVVSLRAAPQSRIARCTCVGYLAHPF